MVDAKSTLLRVFVIILILGNTVNSAGQSQLIVNITKDAHVYYKQGSTAMNTNYGTGAKINVHTGTASGIPTMFRTFIDVDFSAIPSDAIIVEAVLSFQVLLSTQLSGSNEVVLHKIDAPWSETGITWNNQPSEISDVSDPIMPAGGNGVKEVNVTQWVRDAQASGEYSLSFMMKMVTEVAGTHRSKQMASSENTTPSYRPRLIISYYLNDVYMSSTMEPSNDIYKLRTDKMQLKLDEYFFSGSMNLSYEIRNKNNAIVIAKTSNYLQKDFPFIEIDHPGFNITNSEVYSLIIYNEHGENRTFIFTK